HRYRELPAAAAGQAGRGARRRGKRPDRLQRPRRRHGVRLREPCRGARCPRARGANPCRPDRAASLGARLARGRARGGAVKLSGAEAARRLAARPDPALGAILLYGPDPMLVAMLRQEVVAGLIGPEGEAEMRIERIAAGDLRRDGAALGDAMRAQGFFPGPRVVLVESVTDAAADTVLAALAERREGDAVLVATAGMLPARSGIRKGFEAARAAVAIALYPDPPNRGEIEARLGRLGLRADAEALDALAALGAEQDPGAFSQMLEALTLYCHGAEGPVSVEDVAAVAPDAGEGDLDALVHAVAEGQVGVIVPQLKRLAASGSNPTTIAIAVGRHFRALHAA